MGSLAAGAKLITCSAMERQTRLRLGSTEMTRAFTFSPTLYSWLGLRWSANTVPSRPDKKLSITPFSNTLLTFASTRKPGLTVFIVTLASLALLIELVTIVLALLTIVHLTTFLLPEVDVRTWMSSPAS